MFFEKLYVVRTGTIIKEIFFFDIKGPRCGNRSMIHLNFAPLNLKSTVQLSCLRAIESR